MCNLNIGITMEGKKLGLLEIYKHVHSANESVLLVARS